MKRKNVCKRVRKNKKDAHRDRDAVFLKIDFY